MNLITCDNRCIHQRDGYCCLDSAKQPSPSRKDGCCHFVPAEPCSVEKSPAADDAERL